jgi:hypothetical protein
MGDSSKKDFKEFPIDVRKDMGVALFIVPLFIVHSGRTPSSAKPWTGLGSGVYERVEDHRGDSFRAVHTVRIGDAAHGAACVPEEVQVRHCHAAARHGTDREATESSAHSI